METKIYNIKGKEAGKINLPESIFGVPLKSDLIHQVVYSIMSNMRRPIAHTKGRADVRGGGKKPWRQKGTGRARHGSSRSPIWIGGGVTHGPSKDQVFAKKINRKMRKVALFSLLSKKLNKEEILFVDNIKIDEPKAKEAKSILEGLSTISGFDKLLTKRKNSALVVLSSKDRNVEKSFRNFGNLKTVEARNLNALDVITYKHLIFVSPEESIKALGEVSVNKK